MVAVVGEHSLLGDTILGGENDALLGLFETIDANHRGNLLTLLELEDVGEGASLSDA